MTLILSFACSFSGQKEPAKMISHDSASILKFDKITVYPDKSKIEIYCWCFYKSKIKVNDKGEFEERVQLCTTPFTLTARELTKKDFLRYTITDSLTVNRLRLLLFSQYKIIDSISENPEARFAVLIQQKQFKTDTLVYKDDSTLILNGRSSYSYSFNVLDTV